VIIVRSRRAPIAAVVTMLALLLSSMVAAAPPASAANMSQFDPGYIISDAVFYDGSAMSAPAVQAFLDSKGARCNRAADGTACLKDYVTSSNDRAADSRCAQPYRGAANESAATIITKVAQACGINPRVLLVTLQKEQSLVTRTTAGTDAVYRKAMGFGCPDTAACDSRYYGFFNQVYSAAWQLRSYALSPTRFNHRAGAVNTVRYHPDSACGSSQVFIRNQATASLYNYTPYQPNAAALAAGYGTGDSCSSYGNRNFWAYFTDWFGSTISPDPVGFLDSVTYAGGGVVRVSGWALDPDTYDPIDVHVYVGSNPVGVRADASRPDIAAAYPGWGDRHGFTADIAVGEGTHRVCAYAINVPAGGNPGLGCRDVVVTNAGPRGTLDLVAPTASTVRVAGWAWDPDTAAPVEIHVYAGSNHIATTNADRSRPDVAAGVPGAGEGRGFDLEIPIAAGRHRVCAYAINVPTSVNPSLGCQTVDVVNAAPTGFLDQATGASGAVVLSGWAWDSDGVGPTQLHVYVDGAYAGAAVTDRPRPDVAAGVRGAGPNQGFEVAVPAVAGSREVCVYLINSPAGVNPRLACARVAVR